MRSNDSWGIPQPLVLRYTNLHTVQCHQLYMTVFFWYLVESDLSSVHVYRSVHWTSHFLQGTKNTAMIYWQPCMSKLWNSGQLHSLSLPGHVGKAVLWNLHLLPYVFRSGAPLWITLSSSSFFFKCRLRSYINLDFLQFLFISSKIYILQIYLKNLKYIKLKKLKTVWKTFYLCRLRLLIIFIFLFNSENISFYHLYC